MSHFRGAQEGPKTAPRRPQDGPKRAPRGPQKRSRGLYNQRLGLYSPLGSFWAPSEGSFQQSCLRPFSSYVCQCLAAALSALAARQVGGKCARAPAGRDRAIIVADGPPPSFPSPVPPSRFLSSCSCPFAPPLRPAPSPSRLPPPLGTPAREKGGRRAMAVAMATVHR